MIYVPTLLHLVLGASCMWATLCRLNLMRAGTKHHVSFEYFILGFISAGLMFAPSQWWVFLILGAILTKFLVTAKHWDQKQPAATLKI